MPIGFCPLVVFILEAFFCETAAVSDVATPLEDAWLGGVFRVTG